MIDLADNWKLMPIPYGRQSPMKNRLGGNEVAVDEKNKCFYVWESWLATAGMTSVVSACNKYLSNRCE